jgi:hypothetical protein
LAYDGTWRWRRFGERYFNRFWIQLLRHLVEGKLLRGQQRGFIQVEREQYPIGEPVTIEARLLGEARQPLDREQVEATLSLDGRSLRTLTLAAQPNRPGWYRGQFVPTEVGTHVVRVELPGGSGLPPASIRNEVRVGQPDLEFRNTTLDRESLEVLARQSAGGRYLAIDEADQLVSLIPSKTVSLVLTGQPASVWDRWWTLAALMVLLGVEWAVRKAVRLL